jgi:hypothetical protein
MSIVLPCPKYQKIPKPMKTHQPELTIPITMVVVITIPKMKKFKVPMGVTKTVLMKIEAKLLTTIRVVTGAAIERGTTECAKSYTKHCSERLTCMSFETARTHF